MSARAALLIVALALTACNTSAPRPMPAPQPTIAPMAYLAQSVMPNGNPATPLGAAAPWTYERFDFGHYQAEQSFLRDAASAETIWSYPPFGAFVVGNGDGGEVYETTGSTVYITKTQDGGKPGVVQQFGTGWPLFDAAVPSCPQWETIGQTRACRQSVTYPGLGAVDTIISEHGIGQVERFYFGLGWGRLAWEAWGDSCAPVDPARAPALSYDAPPANGGSVKCDERLVVNIGPAQAGLSGANFGWMP